MAPKTTVNIDEQQIQQTIQNSHNPDVKKIKDVLAKAREMKGLDYDEIAVLTEISDPELLAELFSTGYIMVAKKVI